MINDQLKNASVYHGLSPAFRAAFEFLAAADLAALPLGRHEVRGDEVYAVVQEADLKPWAEGRWEGHRRYADIQLVLSGAEVMGFRAVDGLTEDPAYDPQADLVFFREADGQRVLVRAGEFAVFFPQDAHRPCMQSEDGAQHIRKVVVKVRVAE